MITTFFRLVLLTSSLFFLSWFIIFYFGVNDLALQSEDTLPAVFLPVSIVKEKTLYLDTYYTMLKNRYPHPDDKDYQKNLTPFYLRQVNNNSDIHYVSAFPIMAGILALPIYALPLLFNMSVTWGNLLILSHLAASLIVAVSGGIFYLTLYKFFDQKNATVLTIIYLFATINFSLVSQALWQHGVVQLFLLFSLYYLLKYIRLGKASSALIFFGFFMALAVLSRPTAFLSMPFFALYLYFFLPKNLFIYAQTAVTIFLGALPVVVFFLWYNSTYYISIFNQGYADQAQSGWAGKFPEGFLGLWLSPSKGILVYSPIFIFALLGVFILFQKKQLKDNLLYFLLFGNVLLHTLVLGKWKHWYGGWSFGYRMASDVLPYLTLLIVPYLSSNLFSKTKKVFYFFIFLSILMQIHGLLFFDGIWHAAYDRGYQNTSWLWSVRDSETVFNARRVLVKLDLLERACPQCGM